MNDEKMAAFLEFARKQLCHANAQSSVIERMAEIYAIARGFNPDQKQEFCYNVGYGCPAMMPSRTDFEWAMQAIVKTLASPNPSYDASEDDLLAATDGGIKSVGEFD